MTPPEPARGEIELDNILETIPRKIVIAKIFINIGSV